MKTTLTNPLLCVDHTHVKERYQVTIHPTLVRKARRQMDASGFSSFSEYLEDLIRRHSEPDQLQDAPNSAPDLQAAHAILQAHAEHAGHAGHVPAATSGMFPPAKQSKPPVARHPKRSRAA
jgi:hypothetical protein